MTPQDADAKVAQMGPPAHNPPDQTAQASYPAAGRHYSLYGRDIDVARATPGLHIVATPIGNLGDISLRALETLAGADFIACEDTRVTRKLLDRYGIGTPLTPYHDHNAEQARPELLRKLADGAADRTGVGCRHAPDLRSGLQAGARRP